MFKLIEFRNSEGNIVLECPVIIHDGEAANKLLRDGIPIMMGDFQAIAFGILYNAIDTARGEGNYKMPFTEEQIAAGVNVVGIRIVEPQAAPASPPLPPELLN